jgi:hypothetical protein
MPCGSSAPLRLPDWRALPPAQRNALAWQIARQANAARARAIGEALRTVVSRLLGRSNSSFVAAVLPVSARRRR